MEKEGLQPLLGWARSRCPNIDFPNGILPKFIISNSTVPYYERKFSGIFNMVILLQLNPTIEIDKVKKNNNIIWLILYFLVQKIYK